MTRRELTCRCGKLHMIVEGEPILPVECQCDSCRQGARLLEALPGGTSVTSPTGGTHYLMYRKDRMQFSRGAEQLAGYRLTGKSPTRRVVAACCNTPLFVEFKGGHWLSMYAGLWPEGVRPKAAMRTMVSDLPAGHQLPDDIPNLKTHSPGFMWKLLTAWVAMGFRTPKVEVGREEVAAA